MTQQDYKNTLPGYYENSNYPAEYGGVRRQKHARTPGLNIQQGEVLKAKTRRFPKGNWAVSSFDADERIFVFGCSTPFQPYFSRGWLEEIDPITLETIKTAPDLATGGHNWCGGYGIIADGTFLIGFGRYVSKVDLGLNVVGELKLPVDSAHNGLMLLSDGMMITRSLEHDQSKKSVFTIFDPNTLQVVQRFEFVGASQGRFCIDPVDDKEYIYASTPTHIHRLIYKDQQLSLDKNWSASYYLPNEDQGFAWCNTVGSDSVWFMDMGDLPLVRNIIRSYPVGTKPMEAKETLNKAPLRVHRVSTIDSNSKDVLTPFNVPCGGHGASPVYVQDKQILLTFDTLNRKTGAWRFNGPGDFTELWVHDIGNSNTPLYYPDTGEIILDDVLEDQTVDAVVVDIETGVEKGRVATNTKYTACMGVSPGLGRDFYACSGIHGAIYRVYVAGNND